MIYSCKYDKTNGAILEWCKGGSLKAANALRETNGTGVYGLVTQFPQEVIDNDGLWALKNLKVVTVHENGTVEVACV